jgi:hypothetical protein
MTLYHRYADRDDEDCISFNEDLVIHCIHEKHGYNIVPNEIQEAYETIDSRGSLY